MDAVTTAKQNPESSALENRIGWKQEQAVERTAGHHAVQRAGPGRKSRACRLNPSNMRSLRPVNPSVV